MKHSINTKLLIGLGLVSSTVNVRAQESKAATPPTKPNIVVLLADDLGYGDLNCFGNTEISTPNLDRMGKEGAIFSNCYASAPMCSPSRAGLLTGKIPNRTGVYDWIAPDSVHCLRTHEITIAKQLKKAGYQTALHGKWHLNGKMDGSQPLPNDHGFDYYFATQYSSHHLSPLGFYRNGKKLYQQHGYSCDVVVHDALFWLKKTRDTSKPFFQYIAFHETHEPVAAPPDMLEKYCKDGKKAIYHGCVSNLDRAIGRYMDALKKMGLDKNTLIIFTSDNGPASWTSGFFARSYGSAGTLKGRKRYLWEGGIRVPGFAYWPNHIAPGTVIDDPVSNIDFFPTFCHLANTPIPSGIKIDGSNITPLLNGEKMNRKKPLHWHFYAPMKGPNSVMRVNNWVITAKWNGGEYTRGRFRKEYVKDIKNAQLTDFKLYNIKDDIHQDKDISDKYPKKFKQLKDKLILLHKDIKKDSPLW